MDDIQHIIEHPGFREAIEAATQVAIARAEKAEKESEELTERVELAQSSVDQQYSFLEKLKAEGGGKEYKMSGKELLEELRNWKSDRRESEWDILSLVRDILEENVHLEGVVEIEKRVIVEKLPEDIARKIDEIGQAVAEIKRDASYS